MIIEASFTVGLHPNFLSFKVSCACRPHLINQFSRMDHVGHRLLKSLI